VTFVRGCTFASCADTNFTDISEAVEDPEVGAVVVTLGLASYNFNCNWEGTKPYPTGWPAEGCEVRPSPAEETLPLGIGFFLRVLGRKSIIVYVPYFSI
jgi:hypothetical protein